MSSYVETTLYLGIILLTAAVCALLTQLGKNAGDVVEHQALVIRRLHWLLYANPLSSLSP